MIYTIAVLFYNIFTQHHNFVGIIQYAAIRVSYVRKQVIQLKALDSETQQVGSHSQEKHKNEKKT